MTCQRSNSLRAPVTAAECNPVAADKREGPMFQTGVLRKKVNGEMVDKTGHFDKEYHVSWSNVLESILGSFKDLAKKNIKK